MQTWIFFIWLSYFYIILIFPLFNAYPSSHQVFHLAVIQLLATTCGWMTAWWNRREPVLRGLHTPPPTAQDGGNETADLVKLVPSTQVVELIHLLTLIDGPLTVSHLHFGESYKSLCRFLWSFPLHGISRHLPLLTHHHPSYHFLWIQSNNLYFSP